MLLQLVLVVLLMLAVLGDTLYAVRVGRPRRYPDLAIGWFMASIGWAALGSHTVLALFVAGVLHGVFAGWLFAGAAAVEVAAIGFRLWMSWRATPKLREGTDGEGQS